MFCGSLRFVSLHGIALSDKNTSRHSITARLTVLAVISDPFLWAGTRTTVTHSSVYATWITVLLCPFNADKINGTERVGLIFPVSTFDASVTHGFQRDDFSFATAGETVFYGVLIEF